MRRITLDVEAHMLEMLLAGDTYREISREQDVTISTDNYGTSIAFSIC